MNARTNPFNITKANDLTDGQIHALWVDVDDETGHGSLLGRARPASPMPMYILGGKGSGKTHLMRYCSYQVQMLRYESRMVEPLVGIQQDKYVGIYVLCNSLDAPRFSGKGQTPASWSELFSYYMELWLGQALLSLVPDLLKFAKCDQAVEGRICYRIRKLFDANPPPGDTVHDILQGIEALQRELDYQVNNVAFSGTLNPNITLSRGRLIFGAPKILQDEIPELKDVVFSYLIDEFENLLFDQQKHVNTLVRGRQHPATFKVGGRSFGIKTLATFSGEEEIIKGAEFEEFRLDEQYRQDAPRYRRLARLIITKRLEQDDQNIVNISDTSLNHFFEDLTAQTRNELVANLFADQPSEQRQHIKTLRDNLSSFAASAAALGVSSPDDVSKILDLLSFEAEPLVERLNVLMFYNAWAREQSLVEEAASLHDRAHAFMAGSGDTSYKQKFSHFRADIIAQVLRENSTPQFYCGIETFIDMSEGQPRPLLTVLKEIYDWAEFEGETPFHGKKISLTAQRKGALTAADWFYTSMTKAGRDGRDVLIAIDRLAELFRINRFSDNPIECSLIGFSATIYDANDRAQHVLKIARERSFLVEILGGQSERNSERITSKLQLNRMLVPRWRLHTGRRGIATFGKREIEAIFDPAQVDDFNDLRAEWEAKLNAPFSGRRRARKAGFATPRQADLFG
jgi:hypothetical protein